MNKNTSSPGTSRWFPVSTLAGVIGVSAPNFRTSILPLLPPEAVRQGRPMLLHGPTVIEAILLRETERRESTVDSPSLEEIRKWEAKRRELKYRQESGEWYPAGDVARGFAMIAEIFRRSAEAVRVEFGQRAADILHQCWEDVRSKIDVMFPLHPEQEPRNESQSRQESPTGHGSIQKTSGTGGALAGRHN